ncbi:MAG: biotin synthase BioB [Desulfuromonadales bacterium GWD2_61_12]|nr:MAG: biotin synthase BioB [Desulfuromonadales bacterium GWC2_61_20]OGR34746.1 MAG: biotin synthase BioB [Desulfuromonadales bacterium GWD2_61_12]HAD04853.1 biotin synthase BioB [Desulfuromonas sp.]
MPFSATRFFAKSLANDPLSPAEAMAVLTANGADLSDYFAAAHRLRERVFGHKIELCSIINAKSGRCAENCAFCAQSSHHSTDAPVFPLKSKDEIVRGAQQAAREGSHCYGIVTSGTRIKSGEEFDRILAAIREIRATTAIAPSASLGLLDTASATALAAAGCATYHHNLETARSFFPQICTTHDYVEDIQTVKTAKAAGMKVCCGGIFGLGESLEQRVELCLTLAELDVDSIPLNFLNPIPGTPLAGQRQLTPMDCLRIIALFRFVHPQKRISVCGGREPNLRDFQSWIFMAGASGTMIGNYLTTSGRDREADLQMFSDAEVQVDVCG